MHSPVVIEHLSYIQDFTKCSGGLQDNIIQIIACVLKQYDSKYTK